MAQYLPPTENLPIFNSSVFNRSNEGLTLDEAYTKFLAYPVSQGSEEITSDFIVNGTSTFDGSTTFNEDININNNANLYANHNLSVDNILFANNYIEYSDGTQQSTGIYTNISNLICITPYNSNTDMNSIDHSTGFGVGVLENAIYSSDYHKDCAFGSLVLKSETTGRQNSGFGAFSLQNLTTATNTTSLGCLSGQNITDQDNNVCLGAGADTIDNTITNSVAIGTDCKTTADNQILLGTSSQFVKIPNYIEFSDGTTQSTAGGGGGAVGLNTVLATGNTATNKTIYMYNTDSATINGNSLLMSKTGTPTQNTNITYSEIVVNNGNANTSLQSGSLSLTTDTATPTINITDLTPIDLTITGSTTAITNTINSTSNTITDGTDTNLQTKSLITLKGVSNTINYSTMGKQAISIIGDTASDTIGIGTATGTDLYLTATSSTNNSVLYADQLQVNTTSTPTITKSILNTSGLNITGGLTTSLTSLTDGVLNIATAGFINNQTPSLLTLRTSGSSTTDKATLSRSSFQIIGSSSSEYTGSSSTYTTVVDATYTGTLTSNALSLLTAGSSFTRNVMTNLGMTITGASASITNILTSASNLISNATYTTSVAPDNVSIYPNATPTSNYSSLTSQILNFTSTANLYGTLNCTDNNFYDITNQRYATLSSGGYATSGNSINSVKQFLYLGKTDPVSPATATNACIATESDINLYNSNSARSTNNLKLTYNALSLTGSASTNSATVDSNSATALISASSANNLYNVNAGGTSVAPSGSLTLVNTNTGTGTTGAVSIVLRRTKATPVNNDLIGTIQYNAVGTGSVTCIDYGRINCFVRNVGSGFADGRLVFQTTINSVPTDILELNGDENQINAFKSLDMNNNLIVSSTGGITLDTTTSSGTGVITLNTKDGTAGTGTGLVLSGNTLLSGTSGIHAGQHLCLTIGGTAYKIALLNP